MGKVRELQGKILKTFHYVVMKLIWILQRGRLYFATAISFLCTRMKHHDVEYWNKWKSLLCFTNQTIGDDRIIGANDL